MGGGFTGGGEDIWVAVLRAGGGYSDGGFTGEGQDIWVAVLRVNGVEDLGWRFYGRW